MSGPAKAQLTIGADQFIRGMSTSDYSSDGGYTSSSVNINPLLTPGVMRSTAAEVDASTNVGGNLLASCEDVNAVSPNNRYFVDDVAKFYKFNGTTMTVQQTGTAGSPANYVMGKTDLVAFKGFYYGTRIDTLVKWDGTATAGSGHFNESFQTFADANAPHPELVYDLKLWIGDGNNLSNYDGTTFNAASSWVLPTNEKIFALGIDPGTGMMLVSVKTGYDISDTIPQKCYVYMYDGESTKPRRQIPVEDVITAFYNVGGNVFVGMGQNLGLWTGSGVKFLRKLNNVSQANTELPYKHHFTSIGNSLFVVDGRNILAFSEILQIGEKGFFYIYKNTANSNKLNLITCTGNNKLGISYATNKFTQVDVTSTSAGGGVLYGNNMDFPRLVLVRRLRIITTGITTTSGAGIGGVAIIDEFGNTITPTVQTFIYTGNATQYVFDFLFEAKLQMAQPRITWDTQNFGIIRAILFFDPAE